MACPYCGGSSIEYDAGQGNATCTQCGAVLEENTIIAEITFNESSGGAASVVGTFVGEGKTGARTLGPGRRQTSQESREKTLDAARRRITAMAVALKLNEHHAEVAQRYFNLAITNNFIQGRRSEHVVACCLYIVCRIEKTTHMLIDFSELLQMNVFKLGVTFLHLSKQLNLTLPLVDPSLYISRFATMLDFGEDTQRVANDALRLVSRMDRDWIRTGRRPAGICGACLLIAARMHHYRRSQREIIQVVKIGESTLRKRLDEFAATPSGQLTVSDFRELWLEDAADPPSFSKSRKRHWAAASGEDDEDGENPDKVAHDLLRQKRRLSKVTATGILQEQPSPTLDMEKIKTDPQSLAPEKEMEDVTNQGDKVELKEEQGKADEAEHGDDEDEGGEEDEEELEEEGEEGEEGEDDALDEDMEEEMEAAMSNPLIQEEEARLDAEEEARKLVPYEPLDDVDDSEIEGAILNEEEVKIKTQVWMEFNKEYLQEQEEKRIRMEMEKKMGIFHTKKGRRKSKRHPAGPAASAAEAGKSILEPKLPRQKSKKINYSALEMMDDLFDTKPSFQDSGVPGSVKSVFEEPGLTRGLSMSAATSPVGSRHSSVAPVREGSARPGRLSSVSRMIKSKGGSTKFSSTPSATASPAREVSGVGGIGSRTVSREQSMQARSVGSQREGSTYPDEDAADEDEIIAPPKSRTRAEREAEAGKAQNTTAAAGGEDEGEEEEEEVAPQSWQSQFGYTEAEEYDYGGEYDDYNDYD
ncbi:transcription factor TFIIIB subunit brf1 [Lunasporangiospora selenospora]|uniref:B-related factor 1 n=1 Tax=Lunasporangiospora selenospora TaxID=979761 RepID=A0A9P6KI48_9FUNG|nr:transcription factor TFIIIB subunit brf1 [Lunasporangiospora selenospora]